MIDVQFVAELGRIIAVFGKTAYSEERVQLIRKAAQDLKGPEFKRIVDHFISSFRSPPLPKDFFEAAAKEKSARFKDYSHPTETIADLQKRMPQEQRDRLALILAKEFSGATTPMEALEVARMRIREKKERERRRMENNNDPGAA